MIGLLDYGMCNIGSVSYALKRIGARPRIVANSKEIAECDELIIPGVGSFAAAMRKIGSVKAAIMEFASGGKPMLGICLGMQVLFENGSEGGSCRGLGLLDGSVGKMKATKLPHMGWNSVSQERQSALFDGIEDGKQFYFVHSYACRPAKKEYVTGVTDYAGHFASAVESGRVFGVQFHPERSGAAGERLLKNFAGLV